MNKEKNGLSLVLSKILGMYKKYENEIIKEKKKNNIKFQNEFKEGLEYFDKLLNSNIEITNENQDKIFKLIILTLSAENAYNIIETSLEAIEIIVSNNYFSEEIINNNINYLSKNFLCMYKNYNKRIKIIMAINLIKILIESNTIHLRNVSLYNIIIFLLMNNLQINNSEDKTSTYQIKKTAKLILNKCIDDLISKSSKINYDLQNDFNYKYYIGFYLNEKLNDNYFNNLMKYYIDNLLEKINKNNNRKNEKGIDKGKYNWCFNCRKEAYFFSDDLSLPICSKKCENIIKYTEKIINMKIYYDNNNDSIFNDYINVIKIITSNVLYYLHFYLYNCQFKRNINIELKELDDTLNNYIEIVYILLSQPIIKDSEHNEHILDLIKHYVFPFLIDISHFNKSSNNINEYQNNIKLFELLISELDEWYIENLKNEIFTFTKNIIIPYFSNDIYKDDFIENSNSHLNYLTIKIYLMEVLSSNLIDFFFELFINFDNHFYFNNIFINIIQYITNILYDSYDRKFNYESNVDIELVNKIKNTSFNFIIKIIERMEQISEELISKRDKEEKKENKKLNDYINLKNILEQALEKFYVNPVSTINFFIKKNIIPQAKDFIKYKEIYINNNKYNSQNSNVQKDLNKEKRYIYNLTYFPQLFKNENDSFKENDIEKIFNDFFSKNFSLSLNYDDFTAYILAFFIRLHFKKIISNNKLILSHYFSSFTSFSIKVLTYYINNLNFKNYNILEALHLLFHYLPLINNRQVIEKIINIFSNKYIQDNFYIDDLNFNSFVNEFFVKLSQMIVEISFSIKEENNIQMQINNKKLKTINEYINSFKKDFEYYKDIKKIEIMNFSFIYDIYNLTLTNPLDFYSYPNPNSLIDSNGIIKSDNDLFGIFPTELIKMEIMNNISNDNLYILKNNMNKDNIINIINRSWEYFLGIFSKHIAYHNNEKHINKGIENILKIGKVSGMLKLYSISDIFLNSIINMTGLSESLYKQLDAKNILTLKALIQFIQNNGKYIYSSWYSIFSILSRINQLKKCNAEIMYSLLKIKKFDVDKFTNIYVDNANMAELIYIEPIFNITKEFSSEILKQFILDLIKVVEDELELFNNADSKKNKERFFSFNKLIYVIDDNIHRWKNKENKEDIEIYEIVKKFFVKLITDNPLEDILLNKVKESFKKFDEIQK